MIGALCGHRDTLDAYIARVDEGTLAVHVVGAQWWERAAGIEQVAR